MNYLAFDIEAANGYKPYSICSIGIVEADENFNILHRENIWINPKTKYNLNGTRKNVGIDLHLDKNLLDNSPDFSQVYDKIRAILERKDIVIIGHAVDSDVRMLNSACQKYKLPCLQFNFVCSQLLYKLYKQEKDIKALNKIANELCLEYNEHNSEDDAWMSLMTLKYILSDSGLTLQELLAKYNIRIGNNSNFEITRCVTLSSKEGVKKRITQQALDELKKYAMTLPVVGNKLEGKVVAVSRSLELANKELAQKIISAIVTQGGRYTTKLHNCNVYIVADQPTPQDNMRLKRVDELNVQGLCEKYTLTKLFSFMEVPNEQG